MKYIKISKINICCLLKTSEQHMSKAFAEKIEKYLYYGHNINRCYVKCPYCNGNGNGSLKKITF